MSCRPARIFVRGEVQGCLARTAGPAARACAATANRHGPEGWKAGCRKGRQTAREMPGPRCPAWCCRSRANRPGGKSPARAETECRAGRRDCRGVLRGGRLVTPGVEPSGCLQGIPWPINASRNLGFGGRPGLPTGGIGGAWSRSERLSMHLPTGIWAQPCQEAGGLGDLRNRLRKNGASAKTRKSRGSGGWQPSHGLGCRMGMPWESTRRESPCRRSSSGQGFDASPGGAGGTSNPPGGRAGAAGDVDHNAVWRRVPRADQACQAERRRRLAGTTRRYACWTDRRCRSPWNRRPSGQRGPP